MSSTCDHGGTLELGWWHLYTVVKFKAKYDSWYLYIAVRYMSISGSYIYGYSAIFHSEVSAILDVDAPWFLFRCNLCRPVRISLFSC